MHRTNLAGVLAAAWFVAAAPPAASQVAPVSHALDLADDGGSVSVAAGARLRFVLHSRILRARYRVDVRRAPVDTLQPLSLPGGGAVGVSSRGDCQDPIADLVAALATAADEGRVREAVATALAGAPEGCEEPVRAAAAPTSRTVEGSWEVRAGEAVVVTVHRAARDGEFGERTWTWTFSPGSRGSWRTHWGLTFVPGWQDQRLYLAELGDSAGRYEVREADTKAADLRFVPAVFFQWWPGDGHTRASNVGFTAGLGYDLDDLVVMAGLAWTYQENVSVVLGPAIHRVRRARDGVAAHDTVDALLQPDQLHERRFRPSAFLGLTLRLDRDPFAGAPETPPASPSPDGGEDGGDGGSPDAPDTPEEPDTPDEPDEPEEPGEPDTPDADDPLPFTDAGEWDAQTEALGDARVSVLTPKPGTPAVWRAILEESGVSDRCLRPVEGTVVPLPSVEPPPEARPCFHLDALDARTTSALSRFGRGATLDVDVARLRYELTGGTRHYEIRVASATAAPPAPQGGPDGR